MSNVIKKLAKIAGILIVGVLILAVAYKGTTIVKKHAEQQRIQRMYTTLKDTGRLRVAKNRYIHLTTYGQSLLQADMSFKKTTKKDKRPVAYVVDQTRQATYDYVGQVKLPKTLKKGTVLEIKAPFALAHSVDFGLNVLPETADQVKYKDLNISLPAKHNKKSKKMNVIVGYNVNKKGDLIKDTAKLKQHAGEKVTYQIQNQLLRSGQFKKNDFKKMGKTPNIDLPVSWLDDHSIVVEFETIKATTHPTLRYVATIDGQRVSLQKPTIELKKTRAYEKDWQATFTLDDAIKAKLADSKSKRLKITAAYYGQSVESYYYAGNDLSGLYQYPRN